MFAWFRPKKGHLFFSFVVIRCPDMSGRREKLREKEEKGARR